LSLKYLYPQTTELATQRLRGEKALNKCVEEQLKLAKSVGAPLLLEVVRAIASLCNVDPYVLWRWIAQRELGGIATQPQTKVSSATTLSTTAPCWKCPACGKTFDNPTTLARHILYFVKLRDRAHLELYKELKNKMSSSGKRFNEIVKELVC